MENRTSISDCCVIICSARCLKMACDAAHARAAMIASRGSPWRRPPKGENSASSFGQDEDNDEDGIPEPPEVQDLAAELGMGGAGPSIPFDPSDDKPSLARDAKVFAATLACGALATCAPIVQTCSSAVDRFLASLPILDRLVLKAVPPRAPQVTREKLSTVSSPSITITLEYIQLQSKTGRNHSRFLASHSASH
eukprot:jgi/Picre1/27651/NNA_000615.t1